MFLDQLAAEAAFAAVDALRSGAYAHGYAEAIAQLRCIGCLHELTAGEACPRCPEPAWAAELRARLADDSPTVDRHNPAEADHG